MAHFSLVDKQITKLIRTSNIVLHICCKSAVKAGLLLTHWRRLGSDPSPSSSPLQCFSREASGVRRSGGEQPRPFLFAEAIALPSDAEHVAEVQETVQDGGSDRQSPRWMLE